MWATAGVRQRADARALPSMAPSESMNSPTAKEKAAVKVTCSVPDAAGVYAYHTVAVPDPQYQTVTRGSLTSCVAEIVVPRTVTLVPVSHVVHGFTPVNRQTSYACTTSEALHGAGENSTDQSPAVE